LVAQQSQDQEIPPFNPSVSSIMLHPGQLEFNLFSSYFFNQDSLKYSRAFKRNSKEFVIYDVASKNSYFSNTLQSSLGITKKLTIGIDVNFINEDLNYRIDQVVGIKKNDLFRIAPRIRWELYKAHKSNLVFQHYLSIPLNDGDSIPNILNNNIFGNQIIWTIRLRKFIIMNQLDIIVYNHAPINKNRPVILPYTFYCSYLLNTETMLFGLGQYTADFGNIAYSENPEEYYHRAYSVHIGAGLQRRIAKNLNINIFYNHAILTNKYLGYHSINLGIRYATH